MRLVGGTDSCSGRVEILHDDQWGTVCDNDWDLNDAEVVCRQLGCSKAVTAHQSAYFGQGSGPIWLDNVQCSGSESNITQCSHRGFGSHNCSHGEDAGVTCSDGTYIRLIGGNNNICSGTVEILHDDQWGTVCDDVWDLNDAEVVCRQLGCGKAVIAHQSAHFGQGSGPIWLNNVQCSGSESNITQCSHSGFGSHGCSHGEDAGVTCSGNMRLIGGTDSCSGTVEILHDGQWGTVCDNDWDLNDAEVVCRQLGCGKSVTVHQNAHFGQGSGPIWLDDVECSGSERFITQCSHRGFGSHNCNHGEDAGVTYGANIRLIGGINSCSGRVEILHNDQWGTEVKAPSHSALVEDLGHTTATMVKMLVLLAQAAGCGGLAFNPPAQPQLPCVGVFPGFPPLDFCASYGLPITNIKHKGAHQYTWYQDTIGRRSMINLVVVSSDLRPYVLDTRVKRGAELSTDHHLVAS
ncbi:deleted in malignant brain tumors 1 protein-like [Hemibagrus wyckioides]|uniref:deleted in malignant brain tumors 1 protein-like n=1 Tax=Hemibagrus wyckioides TaxID=337641 RepID=UPI00266BDCF6|nr:deleted in malignant brain tumors 1 protein-like [Hemibagrus wyckioides]